ncbi:MAG TPA: F0F1 ATP synthase subunit B [Solirubrobacteraceae bacterium]|nr:F0F1 ATP synthase subunit B [Solirubrobacteraceae bacterium]
MTRLILLAQDLAAEEPAHEFSPVAPVWTELIWAAVFFVVLFLIISRVAIPKLNAMLAAREAALTGKLQAADDAKAQADTALADYRARLADAQTEAQRIIDEGRRTGDQIVAEARSRAEAEAQQLITRAQADIAAERDRALSTMRSTMAELSIDVAGRIVGQSLNTEAQRALVDSYIDELAGSGSRS